MKTIATTINATNSKGQQVSYELKEDNKGNLKCFFSINGKEIREEFSHRNNSETNYLFQVSADKLNAEIVWNQYMITYALPPKTK